MRRILLLVTVVALLPSLLAAQSSAGIILGNVRDPSGASVPGARITITSVATNAKFAYTTGAAGDYYVPSLLPGVYRIEAEKAGFRKATVDSVTLQVNQTLRVDIPMAIGEVTQSVEVAATAPLVQADNATLGQVVANRQVTELPLNGRDFTSLMALNTDVTQAQGGNGIAPSIRPHGLNDNFRYLSVNGARPASISYLIDGVTSNEGLFQAPSNIPPIDAIQEFKLQNGLYSAEFGMGAAQVNIALRSGTNALHGSLWDFLRNDALQPANPRFHVKSPLKQNQFGGAGGGPVVIPKLYNGRDRTFFFVSYEGGRRRTGGVGQAQVPTDQEKQGNFSDWPTQLYNPLTGVANPGGTPPVIRQPFPNNQIPANLLAPQSQNLAKYFPSPNVNCKLPCNNYAGSVVSPLTTDHFTTRIDQNISDKDRIYGQFLFQDVDAPLPSLIPLSGVAEKQHSRLAGLQWTHVFSPRTLNEARVGFNRYYFLQDFETAFGSINYWQQAGLVNLNNNAAYYALPAISMGTNYTSIGNGGSVPFFNVSNTFQYADDVTFTRGRHNLKVGADIRRNQNMNESGFGGNGLLTFQGAYTALNPTVAQVAGSPNAGNAFADFMLGYLNGSPVARFNAFDQSFSRLRNTDFMFYFQDDFRVSSQLTLNLGVRWELHTPFHDKFSGGDIFDMAYPGGRVLYADSKYTGLFNNPILAACCASQSLANTDWRDWAPRVGLAWRPFSNSNRFVARAGYGVFYDVLQSFYPTQSVTLDIPFLEPVLPTPSTLESQPPVDIRNLFPAPFSIAQRSFPPPYCQGPASQVVNPSTGVINQVVNFCSDARVQLQNNKTPYIQQWGLNLQYELLPHLMIEAGYQGSHGLREPIAWSFNQAYLPAASGNPSNSVTFVSQCPPGTAGVSCSPVQSRVPYFNFASTATALANLAQSSHNALVFKVDKRFAYGLQMLGSFTWGKTLDQSSELGGGIQGSSDRAEYSHNLSLERGPAGFDQTRRLVMSWVYEMPFGKGKRLLNHGGVVNFLAGGWQVNGIQTFADGTPVNAICSCGDRTQTGDTRNGERADVLGSPYPSGFQQTRTKFFNTAAFVTPPLGTLGNAGRNVLRSTGQRATDFSAFKNFRVRESLNVQFRSEFFNLFSSHFYFPVFPVNAISAVNFGSLLPVGGDSGNLFNPRIIQFALKLVF
ncbi:MAG TPA: TonB-dependent receptor [Bryobacterales bacterium]|nr:TonB-dependent receptor [Bryobacterales bacterium]